MKLILDLTTVEPVTGSLTNPETGAVAQITGWMSLMSAITDLAGQPNLTPPDTHHSEPR